VDTRLEYKWTADRGTGGLVEIRKEYWWKVDIRQED
jgi:hypothetical protein